MSKIRIGQVGVGHAHASGKMSVYRKSADYDVVGIAEPDAELRRQAEQLPVYKDLTWMTTEQLLNVPGLQAVAVETRVRDLLDAAESCLKAGKHIHLDKPAGSSLPHFKRLLDLAASKHLQIQLGYMFRYSPAVLLLRDFLKRGWLGEPFEVHAVMSKVVDPATRRELAEYPGGMMFELGCHVIDLLIGALGRPVGIESFAQHASPAQDKLADNMLAVFRYERALASVKSSGLEVEGFARRHFTICGSEGTFHIQPLDAPNARIALAKPQDKYLRGYQEVKFGSYPRYVGDAADLASIIRGEKDSDYSYAHELGVQEAVLKASGLPIDQ